MSLLFGPTLQASQPYIDRVSLRASDWDESNYLVEAFPAVQACSRCVQGQPNYPSKFENRPEHLHRKSRVRRHTKTPRICGVFSGLAVRTASAVKLGLQNLVNFQPLFGSSPFSSGVQAVELAAAQHAVKDRCADRQVLVDKFVMVHPHTIPQTG
jgi:hypothetical protein